MSAPATPLHRASRPVQLYTLIRDAALAFSQDNAPRLAAALSYYAFSAIAPLLFLITVVAGYFLGQTHVQEQLLQALSSGVGENVATFIKTLLPKVSSGLTWASLVGAVTVFLTATGLFIQLQSSLNALWGADPPPKQNLWTMIRTRLLSFALVLVIGGLIIAFLVVNTYLSAIAERIGDTIGFGAFFVRLGTFALSSLLFTPIFAFIYKFLPDVKLQWREVWVGAGVTAVLFTVGQILIGLYFARIASNNPYGAAAALFLMLLWIYYSSMIIFFGAEITWVYSQQYGTHAGGASNPDKKAAVADQGGAIDPSVSAKEAEAIAQTPADKLTPAQRRSLSEKGQQAAQDTASDRVPHAKRSLRDRLQRRFQRTPPTPPAPRAPDAAPDLPSIGAAVQNAVIALLAVPSVMVLTLVRLVLGRRK
ncbi:YihY/virulence factor BrkB family protein [Deinococcus sp. KNUC1210]|uniref:YihY/virulence factor BrkB family protein n=1 Tax=Deinococcus sp. KNUC1210 TaxID=2917691 RepID=UPI001EF0EE03|nr:YihY/virulence factor BrkB family protein [Deinococcus sp. KNUC1210]ULH14550.1 YihY/virulence factor BrkB family protein [Deinococcus sp. KNUC1210]